jgi:hypothetical protein
MMLAMTIPQLVRNPIRAGEDTFNLDGGGGAIFGKDFRPAEFAARPGLVIATCQTRN